MQSVIRKMSAKSGEIEKTRLFQLYMSIQFMTCFCANSGMQ